VHRIHDMDTSRVCLKRSSTCPIVLHDAPLETEGDAHVLRKGHAGLQARALGTFQLLQSALNGDIY
jgi:hypothetical protein